MIISRGAGFVNERRGGDKLPFPEMRRKGRKREEIMKIAFDYLIYACYNNTDKMGEEYNMVILGIDPGLAIVGWGALQTAGSSLRVLGYGCIRTPAHTPVI